MARSNRTHRPARARALIITSLSALALLLASEAHAGTLTAQGNVTVLDDISQITNPVGTADFNDGPLNSNMPLDLYQDQGILFHTGPFANILPGVAEAGTATAPFYQNNFTYFPGPIAGGGTAEGFFVYFAGVATFEQNITQVGLTAGRNGTQYLTVWDTDGVMLGQVQWTPANDSAFIGIDTQGVPIGMISYGNDNVWGGEAYGVGGATIMSDTWVWGATESPCGNGSLDGEEECDDGNDIDDIVAAPL